MPVDDRTTSAKLRDAAVELVADGGMKAATVRSIAGRAGVSPGLVRHHFGSVANLVQACDQYVADVIKQAKTNVVTNPGQMDPLATLRDSRYPHLMGYLAHRLLEDTVSVNDLVDLLIEDARGYLGRGTADGMIRSSDQEWERTALVTIYALGSVVLHRQLKRLLDIDITAADLSREPGIGAYIGANLEVFAGMYTTQAQELLLRALEALEDREDS